MKTDKNTPENMGKELAIDLAQQIIHAMTQDSDGNAEHIITRTLRDFCVGHVKMAQALSDMTAKATKLAADAKLAEDLTTMLAMVAMVHGGTIEIPADFVSGLDSSGPKRWGVRFEGREDGSVNVVAFEEAGKG